MQSNSKFKININKFYKMVHDFSDYGSGSSTDSTPFGSQEKWPAFMQGLEHPKIRKASSFKDLVTGKCTLDDVMQEFRMNGSDSPYNPDDDPVWGKRSSDSLQRDNLGGLGPSSSYLRQKSWPAPDRTPLPPLRPLRRPYSEWIPSPTAAEFKPETVMSTPAVQNVQPQQEMITEEQIRVLKSLPNAVLYSILKELEQCREENAKKLLPEKQSLSSRDAQECRFCKNNGERESYYRSHALRLRGRVACPVLRAFTCARCGASGDHAHTIKYCPLSTSEERMKSAAMMRSVRLASGRRRSVVDREPHLVLFGETTPSVIHDGNDYSNKHSAPLDPLWAALEQKLML